MPNISLTSTTASGYLQSDHNQIKALLQDGTYDPGTSSTLVTTHRNQYLYNKIISSTFNTVIIPFEKGYALSSETGNVSSGSNRMTDYATFAFTLSEVILTASTAPVGQSIVVDVRKNGTTVFSGTKAVMDASSNTGVQTALSITSFAKYDKISFDINQAGTSTSGQGLKAYLIGTRS